MAKYVIVERVENKIEVDLPDSELLTLTQAARMLGLSTTTSVRSLIERGSLREVRDPRAKSNWTMRRVLLSEVKALKERRGG